MRGAEVVREGSASDQGQWQSSVTPFPGYHMKGFEAVSMSCLFSPFPCFLMPGLRQWQCHFSTLIGPRAEKSQKTLQTLSD